MCGGVCACARTCGRQRSHLRKEWRYTIRVWFSINLCHNPVLREGRCDLECSSCCSGEPRLQVRAFFCFSHAEADPCHPCNCLVGKINTTECLGARAESRDGGLMGLLSGTCWAACPSPKKIGHEDKLPGQSCFSSGKRNASEQERANLQNRKVTGYSQGLGGTDVSREKQDSFCLIINHPTHQLIHE